MKKFLDGDGVSYLWNKIKTLISKKQDTLVSGTNIKSINGQSLLGEGNIDIQGGGSITIDTELSESSTNPVQNKVITEAIDKLNKFAFPLNLSVSGGGLFKIGSSQEITISWNLYQGESEVINPDSFKINELDVEYSAKSKVYSNVTTNTTYVVEAKLGDEVQTKSVSALFVSPRYFGIVSSDFEITESNIKGLTELPISDNKLLTKDNLELNNQKLCYAYPKAFGDLDSIKDSNNFDYFNSYNLTNLTIDGVEYNIYLMIDSTTIIDFKQIYS